MMLHSTIKTLIIILIVMIIAVTHVFGLGQTFDGRINSICYGYFWNLVLPFGLYSILSINEAALPTLRHWYVKAGIIFVSATFAEICQFLGLRVLSRIFDPIDILIYGIAVSFAALIDKK